MPSLAEEIALAKRRGVPLCQIVTADQIATMEVIKSGMNGKSDKFPLLAWDACNGLRGLNKMGNLALIWLFLDQAKYNTERCAADGNLYNKAVLELPNIVKGRTVKLIDCLQTALGLPEHTILFAQNAQRYLKENIQGSAAVAQAILNLRNPYKGEVTMWGFSNAPEIAKSAKSRMLVLLAPELDQLPAELRQDIYVIEEKLPDQEQRKQIVLACYAGGGLLKKDKKGDVINPTKDILDRAADEIKGMSAFAAEQETALSMTRDGIDLDRLRQRTIRIINQQPGLSIWEGKETFDQIGGLANVKVYLQNLVRTSPPGAVIFIDELEKGFAGAGGVAGGGDLSGTSQGLHGEYLKWHEDNQAFGILLVGVPGCLRGDTPIKDPITGQEKTVRERFLEGLPFHVYSKTDEGSLAIGMAMPPVKYDRVPKMLKFNLGTRSLTVTPEHQFWTDRGWLSADDIFQLQQSECAPSLLVSNLEHAQLVPAANGHRYLQRAQDSRQSYQNDSRLYDGQPPPELDNVQGVFPSLDDALGHTLRCLHKDDQADKSEYTRPHRSFDRRSMLDSIVPERSLNDIGYLSSERQVASGPNILCPDLFQGFEQSHPESGLADTNQRHAVFAPESISGVDSYWIQPIIEEVEGEEYYDFHVPVYNNYWAAGGWNHNCGKSMLAKATGNFAETWIFNFEVQAMKGSLVGQSTQQIRSAFRTINAFIERYPLVIATSNDVSALSPELLSRFALTFFFGIPPEDELEAIWKLQRKAFGLTDGQPNATSFQWTGREVRNCCLNAVKLGIPLTDAAAFISPTILTNSKRVFELYDEAEAKAYISASYPGPFRRPESLVEQLSQQVPTGRTLDLRE